MKLIPVIREALGLLENEEFRLNDINGGTYTSVYRFTDDDFQVREIQGWNVADSLTLRLILIGKREVVKMPFKPKQNENYCFVDLESGDVYRTNYRQEHKRDRVRVNSGNCYRTKEEAAKHIDEWMTKVYGKDWKELMK